MDDKANGQIDETTEQPPGPAYPTEAHRLAGNLPATVQVAGVPVILTRPAAQWEYIIRRGGWSNVGLMAAACLGVCWRSADPPAPGMKPYQVDAYGEAVIAGLYKRGATFDEIDLATDVAYLIVRGPKAEPGVTEVSELADFSEARAGTNVTS